MEVCVVMSEILLDLNPLEVRAALEGRLKAIRRPLWPQPHPGFLARGLAGIAPQWPMQNGFLWFMRDNMSELVPSQYGAPGDVLVGREAWTIPDRAQPCVRCGVIHPATHLDGCPYATYPALYRADFDEQSAQGLKWRRADTMPEWAIRLRLKVLDPQIQRIQAVTEAQALEEGFRSDPGPTPEEIFEMSREEPALALALGAGQFPAKFMLISTWNLDYKERPTLYWKANPFTWRSAVEVLR
jgi:hypothetical protein